MSASPGRVAASASKPKQWPGMNPSGAGHGPSLEGFLQLLVNVHAQEASGAKGLSLIDAEDEAPRHDALWWLSPRDVGPEMRRQ